MKEDITLKEARQAVKEMEKDLLERFPVDTLNKFYKKTGIFPKGLHLMSIDITGAHDKEPLFIFSGVKVELEDITI
jgi:hypothetical protein